jgi:predicted signal transduction protein with EAL and GGDEF domain
VHTSCGSAPAPADGTDIDALYRKADAAIYANKRERPAEPQVPRLRSV